MLQVTESRSCTLSSAIHIFIKSCSMSLLPKAWIKWKKLVAVSLKTSSSFLDNFLQALRLNLIFTRAVFCYQCCHPFSTKQDFFNNFLIILDNKMFQTIKTKRIKWQNVCFWLNIKHAPPLSSPLAGAVSICYDKWIFSLFSEIIIAWSINLFI